MTPLQTACRGKKTTTEIVVRIKYHSYLLQNPVHAIILPNNHLKISGQKTCLSSPYPLK